MGYSMSTTSPFHHFSAPFHARHCTVKNGAIPFPSLSSSAMPLLQSPRLSLLRLPQNAPLHHTSERSSCRPSPTTRDVKARASLPEPPSSTSSTSTFTKRVVLSSALTIALAVANRVFYKLALVPMKNHPFFLAQFTTFGYVVIYFSILVVRYRSGVVTDEMIGLPKSRFAAIGALEALGVASGMAAAAMLPGPAIPILSQTFLVWQLSFSALLLGRTYTFNQIVGCILVATGVAAAVSRKGEGSVIQNFSSGSDSGQMLSGVESIWPALMIASSAFQAGASIIKEFVFVDAAAHLKEKSLDIFVVNSFGSGFQALFVLLFLPFLSNLRGIPFAQLPSYLKDGACCFLNIGAYTTGCNGAPLLPLLYIATNLFFNISLLNVVKISSAVVASLIVMLSVPISIYVLSLPLPYMEGGSTLSPFFLFGSAVLVLGAKDVL
ncbi:protein CLT2, chloroplastic isoform X6 [Malus sylvestris]|uniref:protein CLT2, chloroplastic isoform X2 n=1 Tax=Malus sylvestris TaxID=3752 RepID=UPI0021ACE6FC|nr:protein CLT2, chloroplastic isoform X2 [Malus sylvestris]XP_050158568.1 protein CLT2, chloroplastic isoform X3 [Malus sylvestris]XP_050158569.1 protein CLT2, chloroplastic isoform X4 [Malus sylvestris]XP_050158571.1 protein CLT2, chloroplastic isoform X6 [Malus sylvestris]